MYYDHKLESLQRIFGTDEIELQPDALIVGSTRYPIIRDVIILLPPEEQSAFVRRTLNTETPAAGAAKEEFAEDIQFTFGAEWEEYCWFSPEVEEAMAAYRDIVDHDELLKDKRLCDLGCGSGRASYYLRHLCKEIVLVDFSDAIFVARKNLSDVDNCLYFMGNLKKLPFADNFVDTLFCLGVLLTMPTNCIEEVRALKRFAPALLIYLYYALDNRPFHYRILLRMVDVVRLCCCRVRNRTFRKTVSLGAAIFVYKPMVFLGTLLSPLGLGSHVPLYDGYRGISIRKMEQNAYDRFFTRIEQRVTKAEILELRDTFDSVVVSDHIPYWHFLCRSTPPQGTETKPDADNVEQPGSEPASHV